ncbi:hypothetical protein D3C85_979520 [compost metagenome]
MAGQCRVRHVFATADQGVGAGQGLESRVEGEGVIQYLGETLPACPLRPPPARRLRIADRRVTGNAAFHQSQLTAAEPGAFASGEVIGAAAGLPRIHRQRLFFDGTTQRLTQLRIGDQAETAGQAITFQFDDPALLLQAHAFQSVAAEGGQHVAIGAVVAVEQTERLQELAGPAWQLCGETGDGREGCLFGDAHDLGTVFFRGGGAGEQQWPAAGDHHALILHRQPGLDQRLQATGSGHAGQGPAREGQQQFAGAGAQDQFVVADQPAVFIVFNQQLFWRGIGDHPGAGMVVDVAVRGQAFAQVSCLIGHARLRTVAPDLPARQRVVVEHDDACTAGRGGKCGRHAGGAGADDQQIGVLIHQRVSTCMPSRQRVWQAKRRRPSMVTRHSWQIPIPHSGARRWPLTEVRLQPSLPRARAAATLVPSATFRA